MVLKSAFVAIVSTAYLALAGVAFADDHAAEQYRPSEFLKLDLSQAVLSPKRLGPEAQFEQVPIEAKADRGTDRQTSTEPPRAVRATRVAPPPTERKRAVAHVPARAKLAHRHTNPLDAEARDTRIQTWPCRSGAICGWR